MQDGTRDEQDAEIDAMLRETTRVQAEAQLLMARKELAYQQKNDFQLIAVPMTVGALIVLVPILLTVFFA